MAPIDVDYKIGWACGVLTFLGIWVGCTMAYGFLAFALGWIPAAIIGAIVGLIMAMFGRTILVVVGAVLVLAFVIWSSKVPQ